MNKSMVLLTLFLFSCGDYKPGNGLYNTVGEVRSLGLSPSEVSSDTRATVVSICNALVQKESILSTALSTSHTFLTSQTDCQGNNISTGNVNVTIQSNGQAYLFRKSDGGDFIFPNVETSTSGILADVCANVSNLTNPIVGQTEVTYFRTTGIDPRDCTILTGESCIQVEKAFVQDGNAVVHTRDTLRIRINSNQGRIGFFTQRNKVTKSFCGLNEVLSFSAILK
jgi:hypothetical protein